MIKEQKKSLLRRRKIYTIVAALLVIVLIPTLITITYLSRNKSFEDIDGTAYKIKYSGGVYQMYDKDGTPLEVFKNSTELENYGLDLPRATYIAEKLKRSFRI